MKNANFFLKGLVQLCLAVILIAASVGQTHAREPASEDAVKAAILFNFIRFVEWPESIRPEPASPRVVAIIGRDALQEKAADLASSPALSSRVSVLELRDMEQLEACRERIQVLYIARSAQKQLPGILALLGTRPVLTVSDDEDFTRNGGMMNFVRDEGRIRFDINLDEAEKSELKMNAKLFGLARTIVKDGVAKEGQ
jgi:hypothetical protein